MQNGPPVQDQRPPQHNHSPDDNVNIVDSLVPRIFTSSFLHIRFKALAAAAGLEEMKVCSHRQSHGTLFAR